MKRITYYIQILLFLIFSNSLMCQDYSWIGDEGEWNNPEMWKPTGIPQNDDDVVIPKGFVHIQDGYIATAKYVEIQSGTLKIHANSKLEVSGNTNNEGIRNHGRVEVYGIVESNDHSGFLSVGVGFRNFGELEIYAEGIYSSTGCGGRALMNEQGAFCSNKGKIEVIDNGSGLRNHGNFVNADSIIIEELDVSHGITNHGNFVNDADGFIKIRGQNSFGIHTSENANLSQRPEFSNYGKISVSDSEWWCIHMSSGSFTNHSNGRLSLFHSTHSGINVDGVSTFTNNGTLVTEYHNNDGIRGTSNFINRGYVLSANNGENGINFFSISSGQTGSIVNYGEMLLIENGIYDIDLDVPLHNTDEGYLYTEGSLNGSKIVNDGIFSVWHNGPHNIAFENNGVLEDVYNSLPSIDNNQIVLRPLNGPLVANVIYLDALDKDSNSNTTIGADWFDKLDNGNIAANYFPKPNSLLPLSFGAGASKLWMDVTIRSSGLNRKLR